MTTSNEVEKREDASVIAVAAVAANCVGVLHEKLLADAPHDGASIKLVQGCMAFLTSVLAGVAANPAYIGEGFANACQAVDQSILDEMDRCQHMLADQVAKTKLAEGRALALEQYANWYLRFRDEPGKINDHIDRYPESYSEKEDFNGDDLDMLMEDIDEAESGISDNTNFIGGELQ